MRHRFDEVGAVMDYVNPSSSHLLGHDRRAVGWASVNFIPVAACLYSLVSYGLRGAVLECGVFKGSSTACLSWICGELNLQMYAADSFAGLPMGEGHYRAGDFRGTLDEVAKNLERCGVPDVVTYLPGWFERSLRDFDEPILLLWTDVDLKQSTIDILENVFPQVIPGGVIFSDGFTPENDLEGERIRLTGGEPAGFATYLHKHKIPYRAKWAGVGGLALIAPNAEGQLIYSPDEFPLLAELSKPRRFERMRALIENKLWARAETTRAMGIDGRAET
jgi:predicted O-methyltransferase YrrM